MRKFDIIVALGYLVLLGLIAIGWVGNVYQIATGSYALGYLIVKIIGIFLPPLGTVLGYVGLF